VQGRGDEIDGRRVEVVELDSRKGDAVQGESVHEQLERRWPGHMKVMQGGDDGQGLVALDAQVEDVPPALLDQIDGIHENAALPEVAPDAIDLHRNHDSSFRNGLSLIALPSYSPERSRAEWMFERSGPVVSTWNPSDAQ